MMFRQALVPVTLVTLVAIPAYLLGQKLRHGADVSALMLAATMMMVVLLACAIMRQMD